MNGKYGFINKMGKEIISPKYEIVYPFYKGLATVKLNQKFGFINKVGKEIIQLNYDNIWCFSFLKDGVMGVELNRRKGFVDLRGNEYFFDN